MAEFTAKDVQRLRQQTGAGMMDAKKALTDADGDFDAAAKLLQERGLASTAKRSDRESGDGAVAVGVSDGVAALVELRCETDFVAKSADLVNLAQDLADLVAAKGEQAVAERQAEMEQLKVALKENIQLGRVVRFEAGGGNVLDTYLHVQSDRGVNGVIVELAGGDKELAHDIALHIAFARPAHLTREEFPAEVIEEQRQLFETMSRNEGKPEQALPKIVEGRLAGFFKAAPGGALLEQGFSRDEKTTIKQLLGPAEIVRFAQIVIGE
jgi:elongation factor Ts